ncbi:Hypothetical protein I595_76 [Croceitalea dokdonensis DOKDO 023]|uniref:Uncharacterized protein n=1 Tax=Croceitalea dokdonensis DOKDO 023 TaxID=1300341 RepID=A0A0P7B3P6_9FLAO|nr:DUF6515 family protein [Croceitalea dokdonensis]KPM33174.1 Hypothetical protein I595_76 [Croceitalea dokdonensis DOKDO 023]
MTHLKLVFLIALFVGNTQLLSAQRNVIRVYPKQGTVVAKIHKPVRLVHHNINYHLANGIWYRARGRNYVVVAPPLGLQLRRLPKGNKLVVRNGRKLYRYKGVWYKKTGRHYTIVNV